MLKAVLVGLLGLSTVAKADEAERSGFMIGASLGGGGTNSCRDCLAGAGAAADVHIGWWINSRFAVSYEAWVFIGEMNSLDTVSAQGFGLATATLRVAPRWWVKGGAGLALYKENHALMGEDVELKGLGLGSAAGYELYQSRGSFVVEASGRLGVSMFPEHGAGVAGSIGIGIGWN